MKLIHQSQGGVLSIFLLSILAVSVEAVPQARGRKGQGASRGGNGAAASDAGAVGAAPKITAATDGSMILDKTVMIK